MKWLAAAPWARSTALNKSTSSDRSLSNALRHTSPIRHRSWQRFEREARIVATLNSPHVVQVYEFGPYTDEQGQGHLLLVMEWIDGGRSLRQCMRDQVGMAWPTVARIMHQAAIGLQIAHEQNIVHRDIKPDNMLISPKGEIKLADFGLAQASDSSALTVEGSVIGTPNYLSPEGCNGKEINAPGDVYSLGATCFHLLTGVPVYTASTTLGLLRAHVEQEVPTLINYVPDIPPAFAAVVEACLQKDINNRIGSAQAVRQQLEALEKDGLAFDADLNELVSMADKLQEPSTLATDIDVNAETNVSAQVARTLASRSHSASTTAETVIAADISANTSETMFAGQAQAPNTEQAPSQVTSVTEKTKKPSRVGSLIPIAIIVVIGLGALGFFLLNNDPIQERCDTIQNNVQNGELEIAFSIADKMIAEHPGDKRVHEAFRSIIAAETLRLIERQRFDECSKRLEEYRERYTWLNVDTWVIQNRLAKAKDFVERQYYRDAASEYVQLRKDFPKNVLVARAFLEDFGYGRYKYREPNVFSAAMDLVEMDQEVDALVGDTLYMAYLESRLEGEWTDKLRNALLEHYREAAISKCREHLIHERDQMRIHAFNLLHAADTISFEDRIKHNIRNYFYLHKSHDDFEASHAWLQAEAKKGAWANHKQSVDFSSFGEPKHFSSMLKEDDEKLTIIADAFMPEMQSVLVDWAKNAEKDALRYNAYLVLKHAGALNRIDEWAFHEKTLNNFYAAYHTPADFEAALAYFKQHLANEQRSEAARKVLVAGHAYLVDYLEAIKKNARYKSSIPNCEANIAAVNQLLETGATATP